MDCPKCKRGFKEEVFDACPHCGYEYKPKAEPEPSVEKETPEE